jgi:hypothetical protein
LLCQLIGCCELWSGGADAVVLLPKVSDDEHAGLRRALSLPLGWLSNFIDLELSKSPLGYASPGIENPDGFSGR